MKKFISLLLMICIALSVIVVTPTETSAATYDYGVILMVGDSDSCSVSQVAGGSFVPTKDDLSWGSYTNAWQGVAAKQLGLKENSTWYSLRLSGSGFARKGSRNNEPGMVASDMTWRELIKSSTKVKNKNNVNWVIIAGGYNDAAMLDTLSQAEVKAAIEKTIKEVHADYPNANIALGFYGRNKVSAKRNKQMKIVANMYKEVAQKYSSYCSYITGSENVLADAQAKGKEVFMHDNVHPNKTGQDLIGKHVANYVKKNVINLTFKVNGKSVVKNITKNNKFTIVKASKDYYKAVYRYSVNNKVYKHNARVTENWFEANKGKTGSLTAEYTPYTLTIRYHSNGATKDGYNKVSLTKKDKVIRESVYLFDSTVFKSSGLPNANGNIVKKTGAWSLSKAGYTASAYWIEGKTKQKIHNQKKFNTVQDLALALGYDLRKGNVVIDLYVDFVPSK